MDKYQIYTEKTIQLFLEGKLTGNHCSHMAKIVRENFCDWIHNNIDKIQINKLRYTEKRVLLILDYFICNGCDKILDIDNLCIYHSIIIENEEDIGRLYNKLYYTNEKNICEDCYRKKKIEEQIKKRIKQLKQNTKKSKCKEDDSVCSICIDPILPETHQIKLKCKHIFHPNCITVWTNIKGICPCCRSNICRKSP